MLLAVLIGTFLLVKGKECVVQDVEVSLSLLGSNDRGIFMKNCAGNWGLLFGMILVQLIAAGLQILSKIILNEGTFVFAYLFYRHVVGGLCVLPLALYYERAGGSQLSWRAVFWLFIVALTGISMGMGFYYYGLADTTATYATNSMNIVPIVTFLFALLFRMESLQLQTKVGKIKSLSAIICLGGAVTIALYKGRSFHIVSHGILHPSHITKSLKHHWTRGTIFLASSCLSDGLWFISQAKLVQAFPYKFWVTFYMCVFASFQQVVIGLCINRSKDAWQLRWNLQLLTIVYTGLLATAVTFWFISWAVSKRGATYPSMFNPLALVFVAFAEAILLGQEITVGSLLGMTLCIIGLYGFMWAKNKEVTKNTAANEEGTMTAESINSLQSTGNVVPGTV